MNESSIREREISFYKNIDSRAENAGLKALERASLIAEEEGFADMSLDEINSEIAAVRYSS